MFGKTTNFTWTKHKKRQQASNPVLKFHEDEGEEKEGDGRRSQQISITCHEAKHKNMSINEDMKQL